MDERAVSCRRVHRLADNLFIIAAQRLGLPVDDKDTRELAADCYRAATILVGEGRLLDAAVGGKAGES
jgi:hypothetical protein